jgi:hypothetical protein
VFGGLPLYVDGTGRRVAGAVIGLVAVLLLLYVVRARPLRAGRGLIVAAAAAPPAGLLLLGAVFDNTPIELRYLSFGLPFIGLLIAFASKRSRLLSVPVVIVLCMQVASLTGLLLSPRTMQPFRTTAIEAAGLAGDGIVVVPRGNDGVGIVGAFGIEAPPALPILVVRPTDPMADRFAPYHRVVLALLAQDQDSIVAIGVARAALTGVNWRCVAIGSNVEVYERTGDGE